MADLIHLEHQIKQARNCVDHGEGFEGSWDFKETEKYLQRLYTFYSKAVFEKRTNHMIRRELFFMWFQRILSNAFILCAVGVVMLIMIMYSAGFF